MNPTTREQRRHPRKDAQFQVRVRPLSGGASEWTMQVTNLSRGGLLMAAPRRLPEGTVLELHFPPNVFTGGAKVLHGVVRRIQDATDGGEHPTGVMFVHVVPGGKAAAKPSRERRSQPRAQERLHVKLAPLPDKAPVSSALLVDISRHGMQFYATTPFTKGERLEVRMPRNSLGPARVYRVLVLWAKPDVRPGYHRLGVKVEKSPS